MPSQACLNKFEREGHYRFETADLIEKSDAAVSCEEGVVFRKVVGHAISNLPNTQHATESLNCGRCRPGAFLQVYSLR